MDAADTTATVSFCTPQQPHRQDQETGEYFMYIPNIYILCWGICSTLILLWIINKFVTIRMDAASELLGADLTEHLVRHRGDNVSKVLPTHQFVNNSTDQLAHTVGLNINYSSQDVKKLMKNRKNLIKIVKDMSRNKSYLLSKLKITDSKSTVHKLKKKPDDRYQHYEGVDKRNQLAWLN
ncbi:hypothetical protein NQ315_013781 [Exocentrus adspersus]|uniref:ATP synthase F0 subunit 8 n=1 Tax=Exocentrus adspersus TaxID=1586481 RepID=A0AAV8W582_9CUCU|nr:hypothetical protein NQ315_013781 [Exocentrus adspersus]